MKNITKRGWIPGILAFVFALTVTFAFTRPKPFSGQRAAGMPPATIWIKYDCARNDVVLTNPSTGSNILDGTVPPTSGLFANCSGANNICAVLYNYSDTHAVNPANQDIREPNSGVPKGTTTRCTTNTTP